MATHLFQRMLLAMRAGMQFAGKRNLYHVYGYPQTLTTAHLLTKYQRQDLTSRIVNMAPEEMWSQPPTIENMPDVQTKWDEFVSRFQVFERLTQADKLCAFGPFSVLWLGLRGNIASPAPRISSLDDILYVQAYGGESVKVKDVEKNTSNPRFGQPVSYEVTVGEENFTQTRIVHHSRIVHIVDRPLQGQLYSEPRLAQIYNTLEDMLKITGGSAELFWLTANRGMQVDIDKEMELSPDDANALSDELEEFQHQLRRFIRTRGVKITNLGGDVADPRGVFDVVMSVLAGTTSIPQRILMGSEAGQLASEQDRANWAEYIVRRRKTFGEPYVLKPLLRALGEIGYLPADAWEKAKWVWPEAFHMNPVEEAAAAASLARATVNLSRRNQFGDPVITKQEARVILGLPEKEPEGHEYPEAYIPPQKGNPDEDDDNEEDDNPRRRGGRDTSRGPQSDGNVGATDSPSSIRREPNENAVSNAVAEKVLKSLADAREQMKHLLR